jgi:hypothetical protein
VGLDKVRGHIQPERELTPRGLARAIVTRR